ncbi:zinc finger protein 711-like [Aphomia sociella]
MRLNIEMNDNLPQELCTDCVTFINTNDNVFYESNNEMLDSDTASCHKQVDEKKGFTEHETSVKDLLKKRSVIIFENVKFKNRIKCNYNREENILEETDNLEVREEGEDKIKESPVECEFCHKLFKTKVSLHNHCKTHTGLNVVCEHCGKKFMNKRRLLMHCKAKHGYEKTDKCSYCDYKGCNAELVKIHERTHTGEKPYVCGVCGCGFHRRSSYLQHVPTHLPHKSVPCDECPAMFKSVTLMRIHKSRHRSRRNDGRKRAEKT